MTSIDYFLKLDTDEIMAHHALYHQKLVEHEEKVKKGKTENEKKAMLKDADYLRYLHLNQSCETAIKKLRMKVPEYAGGI